MRAAKWKLDDAKKRIRTTLEWRREYKPDLIPPDEVCVCIPDGHCNIQLNINMFLFDAL